MSEPEQPQTTQSPSPPDTTTFDIWPPTQRTRDAIIHRLIETLSSHSLLSKRYGTLPHHEASVTATGIEEQAFSSAGASISPDDEGIEVLQVYSKKISQLMLDTVKSRSSASDKGSDVDPTSGVVSEEVLSDKAEA